MTRQASSENIAVIFAGGGSGGHIFPGLAIAERVLILAPSARITFLCSERDIDLQILSKAGVTFDVLHAMPFSLRPLGMLRFVTRWGGAVRKSREWIRRVQSAGDKVLLVTTGGFVAAPAAQAARVEGVPIVMVNLDSVPGKANRWIGRHASRTFSATQVEAPRSWETVNPIVRMGAITSLPVQSCRVPYGLDPAKPTLLVTGGSQGARSINEFVCAFAAAEAEHLSNWQILHQSGEADNSAIEAIYQKAGIQATVLTFFEDMASAWRCADLAVCRAGAGTVGEVWANRVPAVFLPYPYHKDRHQEANTKRLVEVGASMAVQDKVDTGENLKEAGRALSAILEDRSKLEDMRVSFASLGDADGAETIADALIDMAGRSEV